MRSLPQHRSVQGRRSSVGPTTARRRPSVRRRPGAGFLPAWHPAARVGAPRERFRVYAEDEYFAQHGQIAEADRDGGWSAEGSIFSADVAAAEDVHGLGIAAGMVLIAGAGALCVVLALGVLASSTHLRRKTALRAARANARAAGADSAIASARTTHLRPKTISGRARRARPATAASHAWPARRSTSAGHRSNARSSNAAISRSTAGRALAGTEMAAGAPAFVDGRGSGAASHDHSTQMAATSTSASHRSPGEFGFER
jgi:hypothetical protein